MLFSASGHLLAIALGKSFIIFNEEKGAHSAVLEADRSIHAIVADAESSTVSVATDSKLVKAYTVSSPAAGGAPLSVEPAGEVKAAKKLSALTTTTVHKKSGSERVLVAADKFGDVYAYPLPNIGLKQKFLLAHTGSTITALAAPKDSKFLLSADREEHIRVSNFPSTFNIQSYCLGHTRFISCLHLLQQSVGDYKAEGTSQLLVSGAGDGTLRLFHLATGTLLSTLYIQPAARIPSMGLYRGRFKREIDAAAAVQAATYHPIEASEGGSVADLAAARGSGVLQLQAGPVTAGSSRYSCALSVGPHADGRMTDADAVLEVPEVPEAKGKAAAGGAAAAQKGGAAETAGTKKLRLDAAAAGAAGADAAVTASAPAEQEAAEHGEEDEDEEEEEVASGAAATAAGSKAAIIPRAYGQRLRRVTGDTPVTIAIVKECPHSKLLAVVVEAEQAVRFFKVVLAAAGKSSSVPLGQRHQLPAGVSSLPRVDLMPAGVLELPQRPLFLSFSSASTAAVPALLVAFAVEAAGGQKSLQLQQFSLQLQKEEATGSVAVHGAAAADAPAAAAGAGLASLNAALLNSLCRTAEAEAALADLQDLRHVHANFTTGCLNEVDKRAKGFATGLAGAEKKED